MREVGHGRTLRDSSLSLSLTASELGAWYDQRRDEWYSRIVNVF